MSNSDRLVSSLSLESTGSDDLNPVVQYNPYPFVGDETREESARGSSESVPFPVRDKDLSRFPPDCWAKQNGSVNVVCENKSPSDSVFSAVSTSDGNERHVVPRRCGSWSYPWRDASLSEQRGRTSEGILLSSPTPKQESYRSPIADTSFPPATGRDDSTVPHERSPKDEKSPSRREPNGRKECKTHFMSSYRYIPLKPRVRILLPAILVSVVRGLATPVMTKLLGEVSNAMSQFNGRAGRDALDALDPPPTIETRKAIRDAAGAQLNARVRVVCAIFTGVAVAVIVLGIVGTTLWLHAGEHVGRSLRLLSFDALARKPLSWYDEQTSGLSAKEDESKEEDKKQRSRAAGPSGAGGMMTRFVRYVALRTVLQPTSS